MLFVYNILFLLLHNNSRHLTSAQRARGFGIYCKASSISEVN